MPPLRLILIEDSSADAELVTRQLRGAGFDFEHRIVQDAGELRSALSQGPWDVAIADYNLPGFGAPEALEIIQEAGVDLPFIIISGVISDEIAVNAMKAGARDFVMKQNLARLIPAIHRELREAEVRRERMQAADALDESEAKFRSAFEYAATGIALVSLDDRWLHVNSALCDIVGYTETELQTLTSAIVTHPDDIEPEIRFRAQLLAGEIRNYQIEKRFLHKDEHVLWTVTSVSLVLGTGNRPRYFVLQVHDISQFKQAENALAESQMLFESFMNHIPAIAFIKDEEGRYVYANTPFERAFRLKPEQIQGRTDFDWLPFETAQRLRANDASVLLSESAADCMETLPVPDGQLRDWQVHRFPYYDSSGRRYIGGVAVDASRTGNPEDPR